MGVWGLHVRLRNYGIPSPLGGQSHGASVKLDMVGFGKPAYDKPTVQCKPSPEDSAYCIGKFEQVHESG